MIQVTPGSHAFRIITLLLLVGEFPFQSLGLLGDERTLKAIATRLSKNDVVHFWWQDGFYNGRVLLISGKSKLKTLRLSKMVVPILEKTISKEIQHYAFSFDNGHFRGDQNRIERHHRLAEAVAFMLMSGIECSPWKNPQLQIMERIRLDFSEPSFYSSRYLKNLGNDEHKKTQYTRLVGTLFYKTGHYIVYNSRESVMRWNGQGERKTVKNMNSICNSNFFIDPIKSGILLGKDYLVALSTLARYEADDKNVKLGDQGLHRLHFIPMDRNGRKLLQIMVIPDWQEILLCSVFSQDQMTGGQASFTYDARDGDVHILSFLDSDLLKLSSFHRVVKNREYVWSVLCFDFQVPFLKSYLGDAADIRSISIDEVHKAMGAGRKALL